MFESDLSLKSCDVELIGLGISIASRVITRLLNKTLKKYGVNMTQAYVMYAIAEYRGYNSRFIAKKLCMSNASFHHCAYSLNGYVKFYDDESDRRIRCPALTESGARLIKEFMPKLIEAEAKLGLLTRDKEPFIEFIQKFNSEIIKIKGDLNERKENNR
jgi:DNA-binding MarR family transcriptional regulator